MKFTLRPYQKSAVHDLRSSILNGAKRPILSLPTGAGKTVTFAHLAEQAQRKGSKVSVVCHRTELIEQAEKTLTAYGINPLRITYGMVQTYVRSPHKIPEMDLCIIDECHIGNFRRFVELLPDTVQVIGVTATPLGASKKKPLREVFDDVVCPVQINDLIEEGFLSKPIYHIWEIDESNLEKDFSGEFTESSQARVFSMDDLQEAINRRIGKTIIFTSSINQTLAVQEMCGGFAVHSKMSYKERKKIVDQFIESEDGIMVNCGILTAGFDDPSIETVIIYRATTSVTLWLQMVGRGSRVIPNIKDRFYIFDMGNNRKRLLAWEANRDWKALFDLQGRKLKDREAPMKECVDCAAIIYASATVCPYCNTEQPVKEKEEIKAQKITVINSYSELPKHLSKPYEQMTVTELIERAQYGSPRLGRPFKVGWILSQLKNRDNYPTLVKELARLKGYEQGWVMRQL